MGVFLANAVGASQVMPCLATRRVTSRYADHWLQEDKNILVVSKGVREYDPYIFPI